MLSVTVACRSFCGH